MGNMTLLSMTSVRRGVLILFFCAVTAGCTLSDLRPPMFALDGHMDYLKSHGREILGQAIAKNDPEGKWDQAKQMDIAVTDSGKSNSSQKLQLSVDLKTLDTMMTYMDGKNAGSSIGVQAGEAYRIVNGSRRAADEKFISLHVAPVRDYFLWPQTLTRAQFAGYAGEDWLGGQFYLKVFVTNGAVEPSEDVDQYVLWINKETWRIDFIEFTLRKLKASYHGVARYSDYRLTQGVWLPYNIVLSDSTNGDEYSHKLSVDQMTLK